MSTAAARPSISKVLSIVSSVTRFLVIEFKVEAPWDSCSMLKKGLSPAVRMDFVLDYKAREVVDKS